jgi:hypothetical protein
VLPFTLTNTTRAPVEVRLPTTTFSIRSETRHRGRAVPRCSIAAVAPGGFVPTVVRVRLPPQGTLTLDLRWSATKRVATVGTECGDVPLAPGAYSVGLEFRSEGRRFALPRTRVQIVPPA